MEPLGAEDYILLRFYRTLQVFTCYSTSCYPQRHGFPRFLQKITKAVSRDSDAWIVFLAKNSSGYSKSNQKQVLLGSSYESLLKHIVPRNSFHDKLSKPCRKQKSVQETLECTVRVSGARHFRVLKLTCLFSVRVPEKSEEHLKRHRRALCVQPGFRHLTSGQPISSQQLLTYKVSGKITYCFL